jgi:hypothetical protein
MVQRQLARPAVGGAQRRPGGSPMGAGSRAWACKRHAPDRQRPLAYVRDLVVAGLTGSGRAARPSSLAARLPADPFTRPQATARRVESVSKACRRPDTPARKWDFCGTGVSAKSRWTRLENWGVLSITNPIQESRPDTVSRPPTRTGLLVLVVVVPMLLWECWYRSAAARWWWMIRPNAIQADNSTSESWDRRTGRAWGPCPSVAGGSPAGNALPSRSHPCRAFRFFW